MSITATSKKNYLRYLKYSLVGIFIFIITEFLTFLLYPRFPDIFAVLIALIISTVIGYFLGKKYVANVKSGKFNFIVYNA